MSATEELRRLLDERGIEHDDEFIKSGISYCDGYEVTYWDGDSFGYVEPIRPKPNTIGSHPELTIHDCTPEQAIAATLGAEECELVYGENDHGDDGWWCQSCGGWFAVSFRHTGRNNIIVPHYCLNCGRKVKRWPTRG